MVVVVAPAPLQHLAAAAPDKCFKALGHLQAAHTPLSLATAGLAAIKLILHRLKRVSPLKRWDLPPPAEALEATTLPVSATAALVGAAAVAPDQEPLQAPVA